MVSRLVENNWPPTMSFNVLEKWTCLSFFATESKASISLRTFIVSRFKISKTSLMWPFTSSSASLLDAETSSSADLDDDDAEDWDILLSGNQLVTASVTGWVTVQSSKAFPLITNRHIDWLMSTMSYTAGWLGHSSMVVFHLLDSLKVIKNSRKNSFVSWGCADQRGLLSIRVLIEAWLKVRDPVDSRKVIPNSLNDTLILCAFENGQAGISNLSASSI